MKVAFHDSDRTDFPNLALMKLSAFHKAANDKVEWFIPGHVNAYDRVYSSKVFTWTEEPFPLPEDKTIRGGSGDNMQTLSDHIEHLCPDYDLYLAGKCFSMGFLTRGCPRSCPWCIVPEKEGKIREHADIDEFLRHDKVILLDNNVLAHEHGIKQIEKLVEKKVKVDFNQGLDARLIDAPMARLLSKVKWHPYLRLACDSHAMMEVVRKAVEHLRWNNTTPSRYFVYALIQDVPEALERIKYLKGIYLDVFAQPFRDREGTPPTREQRDLARWCNMRATNKSCTFEDYRARITN